MRFTKVSWRLVFFLSYKCITVCPNLFFFTKNAYYLETLKCPNTSLKGIDVKHILELTKWIQNCICNSRVIYITKLPFKLSFQMTIKIISTLTLFNLHISFTQKSFDLANSKASLVSEKIRRLQHQQKFTRVEGAFQVNFFYYPLKLCRCALTKNGDGFWHESSKYWSLVLVS